MRHFGNRSEEPRESDLFSTVEMEDMLEKSPTEKECRDLVRKERVVNRI